MIIVTEAPNVKRQPGNPQLLFTSWYKLLPLILWQADIFIQVDFKYKIERKKNDRKREGMIEFFSPSLRPRSIIIHNIYENRMNWICNNYVVSLQLMTHWQYTLISKIFIYIYILYVGVWSSIKRPDCGPRKKNYGKLQKCKCYITSLRNRRFFSIWKIHKEKKSVRLVLPWMGITLMKNTLTYSSITQLYTIVRYKTFIVINDTRI
jgi:hypothetical protein